jgi:Poly(R)-hydroxyalkanoic acid synthase subunit (PHA_synth_III_E)
MENAGTQGKSEPEQAACGAALERFGQLLRAILSEFPGPAGSLVNNQAVARRLAVEFDRWLRGPAAISPWWQNLQTAPSFLQPGPLTRWPQLQAQLAIHWNGIARSAGERFIARAGAYSGALDLTAILELYDLWIECAEQAYAATVHTDDFCRTQAELVNITTALLLEQRRQVECCAPMFGLATRSEMDALRRQVKRMQNEPRLSSGRSASKGRRRKGKTS